MPEKWTTVLIRTEGGRKVFEYAVKEGYIKAKPISDGALKKNKNVSKIKTKRRDH